MFLIYRGLEEDISVKCYIDASFQTCVHDSKLQYGFVFIMNRGVISWKRTKLSVVTQSTTKSEYIVPLEVSHEAA